MTTMTHGQDFTCLLDELEETIDVLLDLVLQENAFLRNGQRETEKLENIVGRKLELANRYYATCKKINELGPDSQARSMLSQGPVGDRLRELTTLLNENRRLLSARHSATSKRVAAVMEAINNKQAPSPYGNNAQQPANEHRRLSLVTGTSA